MKKLDFDSKRVNLRLLKSYLDGNFIRYLVKNEVPPSSHGQISQDEISPEIWIVDDHLYDDACALLDEILKHKNGDKDPKKFPS